jgi:4-hydroxyphenylpyruvate dioxygenase
MNKHLVKHGDGVKDIALTVEDSKAIYEYSIQNGAISVHPPKKL